MFKILLLITLAFISSSIEAKVFSDKEYGYLFNYPDDWNARVYRSGVVLSETNSRSRQAGVQIRLYTTSSDFSKYSKSYVQGTEKKLKATLVSERSGYRGEIEFYEMEFDSTRGNLQAFLYHALFHFPEQNRVLVIQAGCLDNVKKHYYSIIKSVVDSLWVYNASKLNK